MSHVIGRGRYARLTYPISPGAGGAAASVPLSRQRFIDGGTTAPGPGVAISPFKTIADFIASRPLGVSGQDSTANYVGWLMPALNGYTEDLSFPPYVSTELRADAFSLASAGGGGTVVIGNMVWANSGGSDAGQGAFLVLHNISCTGDLTVTDDVGAPPSAVIFSGDELADAGSSIGTFSSSFATNLSEVFFINTTVRDLLNAGASSTSPNVACFGCAIGGNISGKNISAILCSISCDTIVSFDEATFFQTEFGLSTNPVITSPFSTFDGPSYASFVNAGGTRAIGSVVCTNGGADGALVEGANLPTGAVSTNVSFDGIGATAGFTGENCGNHYSSSGLVGNGDVVMLPGVAAVTGDTMVITKKDLAAHTLTVHNGGGAPGVLAVIPSGSRGFVKARYDGTNFVLVEAGSLAA